MHLFLTGLVQIGKSTALRKFLEETQIPATGFLTAFDTRLGAERNLLLSRFSTKAAGPPEGRSLEQRCVARFEGDLMRVFGEVFDTFGVECLETAGPGALLVMDELGDMEEGSPRFKEAVFRRLDGARPVVGVVKMKASPFLDAVRAHPKVRLITVNLENRDEIPELLKKHFKLGSTKPRRSAQPF